MKRYLAGLLIDRGIAVVPAAELEAMRDLIRRMWPVAIDRDLVRVGSEGDGGYLLPDVLDGIAACVSPGVSDNAAFEEGFAARGIPCYLADASVDGPPMKNALFHFTKKFLGVVDDETTMTLDTWVDLHAGSGDLVLQMDIEGAEWPVLLNVSAKTLSRFRVVVVEMHFMWQMGAKFAFEIMHAVFDRLLREYHVVHIHPNNVAAPVRVGGMRIPSLMEFTFVRKDAVSVTGYATAFPHRLDRKNVQGRPDVILPREWHA